jgi:type I restriction enzyme R subunit
MNEAETRAELIDPALRAAGWGVEDASRVQREARITAGRLLGGGQRAKKDIADYVLMYRDHKLAVIEAKRRDAHATEGLGQAKRYAEMLQARFAYSTNGMEIYRVDMHTGAEGYVIGYPTPQELWNATFAHRNLWRERFADVAFEDRAGAWEGRYYQHNAIDAVLEAIASGDDRILLTMATGTGKTFVAFQLAWKLFKSRWNLGRQPTRQPRILFLADRNILADQAYNAFSAFPDDALARINPAEIRKKGKVPKNASVFFTIFQTFMSGTDAAGNPAPYFGDYPPDFFDFIVIDECHRGGASDESEWRGILEYFAPAVQLGLTATPRRTGNADTYAYFGEPVYTYSLKEGINDGFLTPFKVRQISTTLDEYVYTSDDHLVEGELEEGRRYGERDFNRTIEIVERERYRVSLFMNAIDQRQKTLVFCATQEHALLVRDLVNQMKTSTDTNYCVRVTARDAEEGERQLRLFQDNEKTIPTILTTSKKLSTGVDARNVRNIVLMRPINSMIEFKQIIGRGTRLFEGKDHFTIYDFVKAYQHFNDSEWDGEPAEPEPGPMRPPPDDAVPPDAPPHGEPRPPARKRVRIQLADGKERTIQHMVATSFWGPDGKPVSAAEFIERLYGDLPALFRDEEELRRVWGRPDTRKALMEGLAEKGYREEELKSVAAIIDAEDSDLYDVLAYVRFASTPISRSERVATHRALIFSRYTEKQRAFLDFVLDQYVREGVGELDKAKLPQLIELRYHGVSDAVAELGPPTEISALFAEFQPHLYEPAAAA